MIRWDFRCDECGRFIPAQDFVDEKAVRWLITPDSDYSKESYETLCVKHRALHEPHTEAVAKAMKGKP